MDRGLLVTIVLSCLGIAAMAVVAAATGPRLVALSEVPNHVGVPIRVHADVLEARASGPFFRYLLAEDNRSIEAIADHRTAVSPGDRVEAEATPERFQGRLQLRLVQDGLRILRPWREHHVPLDLLLDDPWSHRGTNLVTSGLLRTGRLITPDEARSVQATKVPADAPRGELLVLEILFRYDSEGGRFVAEIEAWRPGASGGA